MSKALRPLLRHGARRNLPTKAGFSRGNPNGTGGAGGLTRRDMLRFGAGGLAAALLAPALGTVPGCAGRGHSQAKTAAPRRRQTVIVVGGGFSGLACADTLVHGGANVIVLEATQRPGGRVRTDRSFIPGDSVELGGEWIGRNHPTWLAYAQEFNLRLEEPGAAPPAPLPPEATPPTTTAPTAEGATTAPSGEPGVIVPRPERLETEMETTPAPDAAQPQAQPQPQTDSPPPAPAEPEPRAEGSRTSPALLALFAQPDAQPPADAPPADNAAAQPAPPAEPAEPAQPAPAPPESAPATQPATTEAAGKEEEPIILHGKLFRGDAADALYKEIDGLLARVIELARKVDPVRPWTSPDAADLDAKSFGAFVDEQQGLSDDARALMRSTAETDNGVVPEHMSLLGYLAMVAGGGFQSYYEDSEVFRLADGNDALATALAQKLGDRLRYNSAVDLVRRETDGVIVRTRDGSVYRGDSVVVTVPPSVWHNIQLVPALSRELAPQMGENVKLILALREAVWEKQGLTPEVTSDGLVGMTWAASDPLSRGPVALTLFSGATQAEQLRRLMPEFRNAQAIEAISPAYPDLTASVLNTRFVDWPGMPLTRASYSFPAPGQVTAFGPALVDGVVDDGLAPLMFAGEHTAYGFVGYMEGALSSGVRVAQTLIRMTEPAPAPAVAATAPAATVPAETQPAEAQPAPTQPAETQPPEAPPADAPPAETAPAATQPPEPAPADNPPPAEPESAQPDAQPAEQNKDLVPA